MGSSSFDSIVRDAAHSSATGSSAARHGTATAVLAATEPAVRAPMLSNYLFCAVVGTTWDLQFFFHSMGETPMGKFKFSSRTLHMASIIIFSTLRGIGLKEWSGTSGRTKLRDGLSPLSLVGSTAVVAYGNYLGAAN